MASNVDRQDKYVGKPIAVLELPDTDEHCVVFEGNAKHTWIPLTNLKDDPMALATELTKRLGVVVNPADAETLLRRLTHDLGAHPRTIGSARLGWFAKRKRFAYGSKIFAAQGTPASCSFVAPSGTIMAEAAEAFTPSGKASKQYAQLRRAWRRSLLLDVLLSFGTVSLLLELLGEPPVVVQLTGTASLLEAPLIKLAKSAFYQPDAPLVKVSVGGSVDRRFRQLTTLHNFPVFINAAGDPTKLKDLVSNLLSGAITITRRLSDREAPYLPRESIPSGVYVLHGSAPGAVLDDHRVIQIRSEPTPSGLLKIDGSATRWGWFGVALIDRVFRRYLRKGRLSRLRQLYRRYQAAALEVDPTATPVTEALALLGLGYHFAYRQLFPKKAKAKGELVRHAVRFMRTVHANLIAPSPDPGDPDQTILRAYGRVKGIRKHIRNGKIPTDVQRKVAAKAGLGNSSPRLLRHLKRMRLATKSQSEWVQDKSRRFHFLTPKGQTILLKSTTAS